MKFTPDLSDAFFAAMRALQERLSGSASDGHAIRVSFAESGCYAHIRNHKGSGAVGLIQFLPATLKGWGLKADDVASWSAEKQVDLVSRYLMRHRPLLTLASTYVAVFMPADVRASENPEHVLTARAGFRAWAWAQNAHYDADGDDKLQVRELGAAVERQCAGPRWVEVWQRYSGQRVEVHPDSRDLHTTYGIQVALLRLGFPPGHLDGVPGPRTERAIRRFQKAVGLVVDGIPGPRTRRALETALRSLSASR